MDIQVIGLDGLFIALKGVGFEVTEVRCPDESAPKQASVHVGGENALQVSTETFGLIANASSKAGNVPPNSAHVQVRGLCLTGTKRGVLSPWLEVEAVQFYVRANQ